MLLEKKSLQGRLKKFDFSGLFIQELGWNHPPANLKVTVNEQEHSLNAIAEKCGMVAYQYAANGTFPDYPLRRKIEKEVSKSVHEHLIIFTDAEQTFQIWQWVKREASKPTACREHFYRSNQSGEALVPKLQRLFVALEEEEELSIPKMAGKAKDAFDVERVTKRFYDQFKREHTAFLKFIDGIPIKEDAEWYASVMLNRMMFVYFIQRKGFLDGDFDYLRNRLTRCQQEKGKDKFYSFYRYFLLRLFHEGFGKRRKDRAADLEKLLGNIPYLNGGMFDVHELEKPNRYGGNIQIDDEAFERIFDYFDQYDWVLDPERTVRKLGDKEEINPDVLGYIFEKYINQKQMGAYYTKEDITEYISKNTILPFLFDVARKECKVAFVNPGGPTIWDLLRENPDRYIYPTVRHAADKPLPIDIADGVKDVSKRTNWNKTASDEYALPTEIWREVVVRRLRYEEIRKKLIAGEVRDINDLITLNLDIRQFAQDVIEYSEGPELLRAFWHAIEKVTVLDPTCGSGAFLFAALNILEPLYESCLDRMKAFVDDLDRSSEKHRPEKFSDFRKVMDQVASHPSARYFVFKSIILNNLFGVDIMEEAVEICKLRLFLKLAAQVEPDSSKDNIGIEPLPDIDFNIRAGNTLVGYATQAELEAVAASDWLLKEEVKKVLEAAEDAANLYQCFLKAQVESENSAEFKRRLKEKFSDVRAKCDAFLAETYQLNLSKTSQKLTAWKTSHQPFHWFIEFYGIVSSGGFDVIIGNPPYVEYKDIRGAYGIRNFATNECSNLFAFVLERCTKLSRSGAEVGMIVPLSAFSTDRMIPLIEHLKVNSGRLKIANFSWRPGKLFDGVNLQLSILLQRVAKQLEKIETTRYLMWDSKARPELFSKIEYATVMDTRLAGSIPKLGVEEAASILMKLRQHKKEIGKCFTRHSNNRIFYRRGGLYWKVFVDFETGSSEEKIIHVLPEIDKYGIIAALSSDLWWWYFTITSDCRHLGNRDIGTFPFDPREMDSNKLKKLCKLGKDYVEDLKRNAKDAIRVYKGKKKVECLSFRVNQSKSILDEIDQVLAQHYGFTEEELDFIINYDIKYRMGIDGEEEG